MIFKTESAQETIEAGEKLAGLLRAGDVVAYRGGMGVGKTTFTIGVARGLGLDAWVSSPTFALVHEYEGANGLRLCHFDMYRITSPEDLYSTGFFDYLDSDAILVVEWSENIASSLPQGCIVAEFTACGEDGRIITVTGDERFEDTCN